MNFRPFASRRELVDFLLLFATSLLGLFDGPWWCVAGTTIGLYSFRWEEWQALGVRARRANPGNAFALVMLARLALATGAAAGAFFGRVLRWISGL